MTHPNGTIIRNVDTNDVQRSDVLVWDGVYVPFVTGSGTAEAMRDMLLAGDGDITRFWPLDADEITALETAAEEN